MLTSSDGSRNPSWIHFMPFRFNLTAGLKVSHMHKAGRAIPGCLTVFVYAAACGRLFTPGNLSDQVDVCCQWGADSFVQNPARPEGIHLRPGLTHSEAGDWHALVWTSNDSRDPWIALIIPMFASPREENNSSNFTNRIYSTKLKLLSSDCLYAMYSLLVTTCVKSTHADYQPCDDFFGCYGNDFFLHKLEWLKSSPNEMSTTFSRFGSPTSPI